jgi:hypothetical protein
MRWNIEVDFRVIKSGLQMDVLCCKSQAMVEKEIAVCLLAYNLVRAAMAKAAALNDVLPRSLRFSAAKRLLAAFADKLRRTRADQINALTAQLLVAISACPIARIGSSHVRKNEDRKTYRCRPYTEVPLAS